MEVQPIDTPRYSAIFTPIVSLELTADGVRIDVDWSDSAQYVYDSVTEKELYSGPILDALSEHLDKVLGGSKADGLRHLADLIDHG